MVKPYNSSEERNKNRETVLLELIERMIKEDYRQLKWGVEKEKTNYNLKTTTPYGNIITINVYTGDSSKNKRGLYVAVYSQKGRNSVAVCEARKDFELTEELPPKEMADIAKKSTKFIKEVLLKID